MTIQKQKCIILRCVPAIVFTFLAALSAYCFDWPQQSENIDVLFAQKNGGSFSNGIVFNENAEVKSSDTGKLLITLRSDSDMGWFDSALGNAVILFHKNQMLTVYGNLEKIDVQNGDQTIESDDVLGISGHSGWAQDEKQCLEFQVLDTKMKAAINPVVLLNAEKENDAPAKVSARAKFPLGGLIAVSRTGNIQNISSGASLKSGTYTLYMNAPSKKMPRAVSVMVNGIVIETTGYDALIQDKNTLCVRGNKNYPFFAIYPDDKSMRLAEVSLSRGKNTIDVSIKDSSGAEAALHTALNAF